MFTRDCAFVKRELRDAFVEVVDSFVVAEFPDKLCRFLVNLLKLHHPAV